MQRAIKFRRRLKEGGIFLLFLLLLAFAAGVRSAQHTLEMNQWVSHTQQVLTEASSVRLQRARMQNDLWFYRSMGRQSLAERYQTERQKLMESARRLSELTRDNGDQQKLIARVQALLKQQIALLDEAMAKAQTAQESGQAQDFTPALSPSDELPGLMDEFEKTEHGLFEERSARVQENAQYTLNLLIAAGILACLSLLLAGYYIQREILLRAQIETGLLRARELMGTQLNEQRSELGHAVDDLHTEILARNRAEAEMRRLNLELEERVARRTAELREANRELESFNYSVSHDLRAPLRHMDGFSRILEEEFASELSEKARHYLHWIRVAAARMTDLVDDLLQLARLGQQSIKRQRISVGKLVDETVQMCMEQESGREIEWQILPMPEVEADSGLLRQVLTNLISNALKFTKNKERAVIEIGSMEAECEVTIYVKDNGAGFDQQYADKLFGVFQRLHRQDEFEGTGIGLAIVARIIQKHGGRVWAEAKPECGATFYFTMAAATAKEKEIAEHAGAIA